MKVKQSGKSIVKFIGLMVLCGAGGAAANIFLGWAGENLGEGLNSLITAFCRWYLPIQLLAGAGMLGAALWCCKRCAALPADPEDEEAYDQGELWLGRSLCLLGIHITLCIFFFGLFAVSAPPAPRLLAGLVLFMVMAFLGVAGEVKAVNLTKARNPEKRGDALGPRFRREWLESCDEAERLQIGQASYASNQATQAALGIAWIIAIIAGVQFGQGYLPVVLVGAVWTVNILAYHRAALGGQKKTKRSKEEDKSHGI